MRYSNSRITYLLTYFINTNSMSSALRPRTTWKENYSVSQKNPAQGDLTFFHFFHKWLRIFNRFFTHLLYVPIYARLQIFIHLAPILTKLCHIKRDYPVHIICSECPPSAKTHAFRLQTFA